MSAILTPSRCLVIAAVIGFLIVASSIQNQGYLSTGDHGRDLYAFERTLHGEIAYKDYWWVYGPLMPFYFALFMKILGVSISSVLVGKAVLTFSTGLLIYLALARTTQPIAALLGSVWFFILSRDFFFTYNHAGGILCVSAIAAILLTYIKSRRHSLLWAANVIAFILCFIKINFGFTGFIITAFTAFIVDRSYAIPSSKEKQIFTLFTLIGLPIITLLLYTYLLRGMTLYEIRQCLPYSNADQPYNTYPWLALAGFITKSIQHLFTDKLNLVFGTITAAALIRVTCLAIRKQLTQLHDKEALLSLCILGAYSLLNYHEFLKSGVMYRSLWIQPLTFLLSFTLLSLAIRHNRRSIQNAIWILILFLTITGMYSRSKSIVRAQHAGQRLELPRTHTSILNDQTWIQTVTDTTRFLNDHLKPDEQFLAIPYDPLYYYLTGRKSPIQLLIFFDHINIPREQERRIIQDLENNRVNWIVLSSRMKSKEKALGEFGITYCPLIKQYIQDNFISAARFGDWENEPGWAKNHGTILLKRKH